MSVYKATSWGRTRGPKNVAGAPTTEAAVVTVSDLVDATDGYSTENQRYLHVLVIDKNATSGTSLTVSLFGYNHAFGKWFPLRTIASADMTPSDNSVAKISAAAQVTVGDSGTAEGSQVASDRQMETFEVVGVDRVAFVGTTAHVRVFAACSTF